MGWFTGIKNLFGGSEAAEHVVKRATDGMYYGLDKLVYTNEEKAEDTIARYRMVYDFVSKTFDENSFRNVTRRWLAWAVTLWTLINAQLTIVCIYLAAQPVPVGDDGQPMPGVNYQAIVDGSMAVAKSWWIGEAFVGVMVAYFGVQFFRGGKSE